MNPEGPWPHWLPNSVEHFLNGVVSWVQCSPINSWNGWSPSVCCCVVRTVTWLPMRFKMADVYLDGTPSRMGWKENRHVPDWLIRLGRVIQRNESGPGISRGPRPSLPLKLAAGLTTVCGAKMFYFSTTTANLMKKYLRRSISNSDQSTIFLSFTVLVVFKLSKMIRNMLMIV